MNKKYFLFIVSFLITFTVTNAQDTWDNQLFAGNRIAWGKGEWKQTDKYGTLNLPPLIESAFEFFPK